MKKLKKGFSLIELLISISVIIIISSICFYFYSKNLNETKVNETASFLNTSSAQIRNNNIDYSGLTNEDLFSLGIINDGNTQNKLGGDLLFQGDKKGFSFNLTNISHSNCIAILSRTSYSYNLANNEPIISQNIGAFSNLCQGEQLLLSYKFDLDIKRVELPDSEIDHGNIILYPPNAEGKTNSTNVVMTGGSLTIESNNGDNDMNRYLAEKTGVSEEMKTTTSSTGYQNSNCGVYANGSSCGSLTMDQYLNELLNAPEEMWDGTNVEFQTKDRQGREMSDSDFNSICSQFVCTPKGNDTYTLTKKDS